MTNFLTRRLVAVLFICLMAGFAWATDPMNEARQAWQLLDYIAVDYAGAVRNGQVVEPGEYAEMQEFAETVSAKIAVLPASPEQSKLKAQALQLKAKIADHADPHVVATAAHALAISYSWSIKSMRRLPRRLMFPMLPLCMPSNALLATAFKAMATVPLRLA